MEERPTHVHPAWVGLAVGPTLRPWQEHAVSDLVQRLTRGESRLCLIAPPGAGKTVCALAVAAALERAVEVRVPTTVLVKQWEARVRQVLVSMGAAAELPPVRVCTYAAVQSLTDGALVLLDEAHHLTATWGQRIQDQLRDDHLVLGLTATPPIGAVGWDRFITLVGDEPVEIAAPPLVRDGQLCPYQDLVWPVVVDLDDTGALGATDLVLGEVEQAVAARFGVWESQRLREDLWTLTEERFAGESGLLVALCRRRIARGETLPADLPLDPELVAPLTLHDRALALWSFAPKDPVVRAALGRAGFRLRKGGPVLADDVAWRGLSGSRARLRGTADLLAAEHAARGDGLRAVIVCDRDVEGERLSARQVLKALVADPRTDALDPILVTGSVFWVDDDLWPRVRDRIPDLPWQKVAGHHEVDVQSWSTSDRVALVTRLLTDGITRCLVGTRHLLGEGWDCPAVNCVVDLTGISAAVTVNQIRGRALRPDPADSSKVASMWDVIALAPHVAGGDRMLETLQARHQHTFGVDEGGRIRAGVGRIDATLTGSMSELLADVDGLRARMLSRVGEGASVVARWAVGRDYRNRRVWRVGGPVAQTTEVRVSPPAKLVAAQPTSVAVRLQRRQSGRWGLMVAGPLLGAVVGAVLFPPLCLLAGAVGAGIGLGGAALGGLALSMVEEGTAGRAAAMVRALHAALSGLHPGLQPGLPTDLGTLCGDGEVWWVDAEPASSRRFAAAVGELFGPVRHPRYLLIEGDGRIWPIPGELGARRDLADGFVQAWAKHVGPCAAVYARTGPGREILRTVWQAGGAGRAPPEIVEDWE